MPDFEVIELLPHCDGRFSHKFFFILKSLDISLIIPVRAAKRS